VCRSRSVGVERVWFGYHGPEGRLQTTPSLHTGTYTADDTRRPEYDSALGNTGLAKPTTSVEDISGN